PLTVARAEIKLRQLSIAQGLGVSIPATRVTNDPSVARNLASGKQIIAKPVSPGEGIAPFVDTVHDGELDLVRTLPTMLQELIHASADLRVVVIGEKAWVWRRPRESKTIDWRRVDEQGSMFALVADKRLEQLALKVAAGLQIRISIQDWLETKSGP